MGWTNRGTKFKRFGWLHTTLFDTVCHGGASHFLIEHIRRISQKVSVYCITSAHWGFHLRRYLGFYCSFTFIFKLQNKAENPKT